LEMKPAQGPRGTHPDGEKKSRARNGKIITLRAGGGRETSGFLSTGRQAEKGVEKADRRTARLRGSKQWGLKAYIQTTRGKKGSKRERDSETGSIVLVVGIGGRKS